uniref:Uncharacterized protein n=1 Tax=Kalanchoe fedtschenkoi TaxID=63787 RepID=A0A7N0VGE9_KALFE
MATSTAYDDQNHHQQNQNMKQRLHNFSLSLPKWGSRSQGNSLHRNRRSTDPPPEQHRALYGRSPGVGSREMVEDSRRLVAHEDRGSVLRSGSGICVDFSSVSVEEKRRSPIDCDGEVKEEEERGDEEERDSREEAQKIWNLRPRKNTAVNEIGLSVGAGYVGGSSKHQDVHVNYGGVGKNKAKVKLWISLSKEEIEDDIFSMTGSRPARRPKRRPKSVQKQLDCVFPGLVLLGATADTFKIQDSPPKK